MLPVDIAVAARVAQVPRALNADPGDRIIVATAEVHRLEIISSDRQIPAEQIQQLVISRAISGLRIE